MHSTPRLHPHIIRIHADDADGPLFMKATKCREGPNVFSLGTSFTETREHKMLVFMELTVGFWSKKYPQEGEIHPFLMCWVEPNPTDSF